MKHLALLALLLAGCTTENSTYLMVYQPDAAEAVEDAAVDLVPGFDATAEPDASPATPDATEEDVATDAPDDPPSDAADGPEAWTCPAGMVQSTGALRCIDTLEVSTDDYLAWQGSPGQMPSGCNQEIDLPLPAPIATPWASATWCGVRAWCENHGKRLCTAIDWSAACTADIDTTPEAQWPELAAEWMDGGGFWLTGTLRPTCGWTVIDPYSIDQARIRCCKDLP